MAAAIVVPDNLNVGEALEITGTGFANTHAYTIALKFPGANGPDVVLKGTTSGGGAITSTDAGTIVLNQEGEVEVSVSDGTSTKTDTVRVWRVG